MARDVTPGVEVRQGRRGAAAFRQRIRSCEIATDHENYILAGSRQRIQTAASRT
jgi:hypothetical protein